MGKGKWIAGGVVALVVIGSAASCGGDDDSSKSKTDKPAASHSASQHADTPSSVPSPNADQRAKLLAALKDIDAGLVANEDRAVRRSVNVCSDIKAGKDGSTVKDNAIARFEGGTVPNISDDQGAQIVTAVKDSFCSTGEKEAGASKEETKSAVQQFKEYVSKNGTPTEAAAVKHVTKIQGGDDINNILDTADVYTDYTGGMMGGHANDGKLIATAFADWQQSRGKASENGLVTVYDANAEVLSNGKF